MSQKFDQNKWNRAAKRQQQSDKDDGTDPTPSRKYSIEFYQCYRCNADEQIWDGIFFVNYEGCPHDVDIHCPTCGCVDQVELIGRGEIGMMRWFEDDKYN